MKQLYFFLFVSVIVFSLSQKGYAQSKKDNDGLKKEKKHKGVFRDSLDNKFDIGKWMSELNGVLPLPSIITEPAVGYGINLNLVFFHPTNQSINKDATKKKQLSLPSMTVAGGLYTENGTWGAYAGHYGSYKQDKIRIAVFGGWTNINIDYYLTGPLGNEHKLAFNFSGIPIYLSFAHKIGSSKWYGGGNYFFFRNNITLKTNTEIPAFDSLSTISKLGGLGVNFYWQDFDNAFTPQKGSKWSFRFGYNDNWLGSDFQYSTAKFTYIGFANPVNNWVMGFRTEFEAIFGNEYPFYVRPFIGLRGIPIMRYQGDYVITLETEHRVNITPRWALDGFIGTGITSNYDDKFTFSTAKWAGGGGFRYLLARWFNMYGGIDVAVGPDGWAWYIILGNYWIGR